MKLTEAFNFKIKDIVRRVNLKNNEEVSSRMGATHKFITDLHSRALKNFGMCLNFTNPH